MDLPDVEARWAKTKKRLKQRIAKQGSGVQIDAEPFGISAVTGLHVKSLLYRAAQLLQQTPAPAVETAMPVYRPEADPKAFTITHEADGWRVSGPAIERAAKMTYWEHYQSVRRFQRILETLGIDKALRKAGIQNGDTVYIGDFELEWQD